MSASSRRAAIAAAAVVMVAALAPRAALARAADATAADERTRVVVLDVSATSVPPDTAALLTRVLATTLAADARLSVLASDDLRRIAELEGQKQIAGCASDSCMAEVADALGARWVVFGDVAAIGEQRVVTLTLFDAANAAVAHKALRTTGDAGLVDATRDAGDELVGVLVPRSPGALVFAGGSVAAVGLVVAVAGVGAALWATGVRGSATSSGDEKATAGAVLQGSVVAIGVSALALVGGGAALAWGLADDR